MSRQLTHFLYGFLLVASGLLTTTPMRACAAPRQAKIPVLMGRVRGPDGKAAGLARIHIRNQTDPSLLAFGTELVPLPRRWEVNCDAKGMFRLRLPPGQLYRVWAEDRDGSAVSTVQHAVHHAQALRLDLRRASGIQIQAQSGQSWRVGFYAFSLAGTTGRNASFPC